MSVSVDVGVGAEARRGRARGSRSRSPRGACCRGSAARRRAPRPGACGSPTTEKRTTVVTRTNTGTETMIRTSQSVSILSAWVDAGAGNQSMASPRAMPTPRRSPRRRHLAQAAAVAPAATRSRSRAALLCHGPADKTRSGRRWTAPWRGPRAATAGPPGRRSAAAARSATAPRRRDARRAMRKADGASAVVAAERLRELRRLAVADAVGDLADGQAARGQHLGGALHPHRGQVLAERRAARSRRTRAAAGGGTRRRGGRCRRARGRRRTPRRRSRRPPGRGWCGGGWSMVAAWSIIDTSVDGVRKDHRRRARRRWPDVDRVLGLSRSLQALREADGHAGAGRDERRRADGGPRAHACARRPRLMSSRRVGAAVVLDPDAPGLGIITERDLLDALGAGQDPDAERVGRPPVRATSSTRRPTGRWRRRPSRWSAAGSATSSWCEGEDVRGIAVHARHRALLDGGRLDLRGAALADRRLTAAADAAAARARPRTDQWSRGPAARRRRGGCRPPSGR